jgi:multiple sugar transport system permease protein
VADTLTTQLNDEAPPWRKPAKPRTSWLLTVVCLLLAAYFLLPLFWLVVASTKSNDDLFSSFGLWFADFNLFTNLQNLFTAQDGIYLRWMANSLIYAIISGVGAAFLATAAGYAFAKYKFPGSSAMFSIILGSIMVPTTALAIPTYLIFARAGLTDTYASIIIPSLVSPFGVFLSTLTECSRAASLNRS